MSLVSRLFGKPAAPDPAPVAAEPAPIPTIPDPTIVAHEDEKRLAEAVASGALQSLTDCVLNAHSTMARQRAAHLVTDPDHLRELIRLTRGGKDNSVYRILTTKRDALLATARDREARQTAVHALISSLARRSRLPYDPLYESSLALFEQDWTALSADASPDATAQATEHLATMRAVIERHWQGIAAEADKARVAAAAAAAAAEASAAAAATARLEREQVAAAAAPAAEPTTGDTQPVSNQPLISLLRQAQSALDHGGTARAERLRAALAEKLAQPASLPSWFDRQLQLLDDKLNQLKDWKTFTVVPKRVELVQRMQSLIEAEIPPEKLAQHIRRLQDEWRTLNRGAGDDDSAEEALFHEAAKRAYEPCREHFSRQAGIRQANQRHRESIIARLTAYATALDGNNVEWRHVAQTIVEARREWRQFAPVDNAMAQPLQQRLYVVLGDLQGRLDAEYARNIAAKLDLIERAQGLVKLNDIRQAIEGAKELQKVWRTIGPVPRERSNSLWDDFRGHCDAIFLRSAREAAEYSTTLLANESRARALCDELDTWAALSAEALRIAMLTLDERRAEFEALDLPRQSARDLRNRFARCVSRCTDAVRHERTAAARRSVAAVFDAATAIRAYALAQLRSDGLDAARSAATAAIATAADAPKAARAALQKQFSQVAAGHVSGNFAANESALRLICIRAELEADVATPESDLNLRRDYQMRRLLQKRALGEDSALANLDELALEWCSVGPVVPSIEAALRGRFDRCREARERARTGDETHQMI